MFDRGCDREAFHMPGDPTEYREHAKECMRWAMSSRSDDDCERFQELAEFWMRLAVELEATQAPRTVVSRHPDE
jgi:hypothetical protein